VQLTDPEASQGGIDVKSSYAATLRNPELDAQQTWLTLRKATPEEKTAAQALQSDATGSTTSCPWASMTPQIIEKILTLLPQKTAVPQMSIDAIHMRSGKVLAHNPETHHDYWQAGLSLEGNLAIKPNPGPTVGHTLSIRNMIRAFDLQINADLQGDRTVGVHTAALPFKGPPFQADMAAKLDLGTWAGIGTVDLHHVQAHITSNDPRLPSHHIALGNSDPSDLKTHLAVALRPHEETSETCYQAARGALSGDLTIPAKGTFQRHAWAVAGLLQSDAQHALDLGIQFPIPDATVPGSWSVSAKTQAMGATVLLSAHHAPRVDTDTLVEVSSELRGTGKEEPWLRNAHLFD
jgi:hypothetical protein